MKKQRNIIKKTLKQTNNEKPMRPHEKSRKRIENNDKQWNIEKKGKTMKNNSENNEKKKIMET